jgi:hypothetical protein
MKTTTSAKPTHEGTLPKRNAKTGRFEKGTAKPAAHPKPVVGAAKPVTPAKPAVEKAKKA